MFDCYWCRNQNILEKLKNLAGRPNFSIFSRPAPRSRTPYKSSGGNISHQTFRHKLAWLGKRYPNMGAEGCTASATVINGLYFRVILSLVVFASLLVCNQNILEKLKNLAGRPNFSIFSCPAPRSRTPYWPSKRYPNMGAEGCTASATVILVLLFRAILSLVVFDCYWRRNQNILEKN